jgi:hypothetical protein
MRVGASDGVGSYSMRYVVLVDESDGVGELYRKVSYKTRPYDHKLHGYTLPDAQSWVAPEHVRTPHMSACPVHYTLVAH